MRIFRVAFVAVFLSLLASPCPIAQAQTVSNSVILTLPGGTPCFGIAPATVATSTCATGRSGGYVVAGVKCFNTNSTYTYLHIFNKSSVTLGTTSADHVYPCNPTGGFVDDGPTMGVAYNTGIIWYVSGGGGLTDTTAITANTTYVEIIYQ